MLERSQVGRTLVNHGLQLLQWTNKCNVCIHGPMVRKGCYAVVGTLPRECGSVWNRRWVYLGVSRAVSVLRLVSPARPLTCVGSFSRVIEWLSNRESPRS